MHRLSRALTALRAHWPSVAMYLGFALAFFGARLWLMHEVGSATPYWDQWDAEALRLYQPYLNGTLDWQTLFAAHNEHRIFTTRIVALALLELNQRWNPLLHMMFNAALFTAVMTGLCHRLARLLGPRSAPLLLTFALVAFSMPSAWENTLLGMVPSELVTPLNY